MSATTGAIVRWVAPCLTVAAVVGSLVNAVGPTPTVRLVDAANSFAGQPLYVDPNSAAARAAQSDNPPSAELNTIAGTPQTYWIDNAVPSAAISRYIGGAQAAGAMPVLPVYSIPHRDCGSFASGGFSSGADYRQWIDGVAGSRTNGARYVIDTSRNGAGPAPDSKLNWCNPSGRALGAAPSAATAGPHADAYLWVKRPGDSDGSCGRGEPGPGHFMNQYAIDLARAAGH